MNESEKLKTGTTTVGIVCKDGVVLASETKATLGYLVASKESKKIYQVDDKIALTTAGGAGDAQNLVRVLKAEIKLYKMTRESEFTVKACTTLISNILQENRYYPIMAMLIVGGHDRDGFHLWSIDPVGGSGEDKFIATGSGSPIAYGVLEDGYKEGMSKEEGIELAIRSIKSARERDIFSGGRRIDVVVIDESGLKFLSENEVNEILEKQ